jgi:uncharacterized protein (DUF58 family)
MRGVAAEFTEYRPYRQGDEPRRIDWKLYARSGRAYLRLATERATLPTVIVVDASASMAFPAESLGKWAHAKELAVGLTAVAHAAGDPVGLAVARGGRDVALAPRTRRGVVVEVARALDALAAGGSAPLAPTFERARRRAARVALVTDFLGDADALLRLAREHVAGGGEVHAVHVVASEELHPPTTGVIAVDPEEPRIERPLVVGTRAAYDAAFRQWREALAAAWRAGGAAFTLVVTDEDPAHAVRRIAAPPALAAKSAW